MIREGGIASIELHGRNARVVPIQGEARLESTAIKHEITWGPDMGGAFGELRFAASIPDGSGQWWNLTWSVLLDRSVLETDWRITK